MKTLFIILLFSLPSLAKPAPARLRYSVEFIFQKVLEKKRQVLKPEIPFPALRVESETPLVLFQDAMESQWHMRPERFTNAYSVKFNTVFLSDDAAYYERTGRCMDDSLVHELVHYVQAKYQGFDLDDESLEWDAVDIQSEFREEFCQKVPRTF